MDAPITETTTPNAELAATLITITNDPFVELDEGGYDDMLGYASRALRDGISAGLGLVFISDEIVDTHPNALPSLQLIRSDGRCVHVYRIDLESELADNMTDTKTPAIKAATPNEELAAAIARDGRPLYLIAKQARINTATFKQILNGDRPANPKQQRKIAGVFTMFAHEIFGLPVVNK